MTRIRVCDGAKLNIHNRIELSYDITFSLAEGAEMNIGYFYAGIGDSVICEYKRNMGNNVIISRGYMRV